MLYCINTNNVNAVSLIGAKVVKPNKLRISTIPTMKIENWTCMTLPFIGKNTKNIFNTEETRVVTSARYIDDLTGRIDEYINDLYYDSYYNNKK